MRKGGPKGPTDMIAQSSRSSCASFGRKVRLHRECGRSLEVDHFVAPCLEPPPQGRERIVVTRRGEAQDADTTPGSALAAFQFLCLGSPPALNDLRFVHARLSFSRSFLWDM